MRARIWATLKKYPLVINSTVYAGLYSAGNLTQQTLQEKPKYDFSSTGHMAILGAFAFAPFNYSWYKILDSKLPGTALKTVTKKVIIDQGIAGPIGICIFYIGTAILERKEDKFAELKQKGLNTFLVGCVYWPTIQMFNFLFLAKQFRTAYVGVAAYVWTNILCFFKLRYGISTGTCSVDSAELQSQM